MKKTPWFIIDEVGNPVRNGLYEVLYGHQNDSDDPLKRYFSEGKWYRNEKLDWTNFGFSPTVGERWRGLASDPS